MVDDNQRERPGGPATTDTWPNAHGFPTHEVRTECEQCPHTHPVTFVGDGRLASNVHPHDATIIHLVDGVEKHRLGVGGGTRWIVNSGGPGRVQVISP